MRFGKVPEIVARLVLTLDDWTDDALPFPPGVTKSLGQGQLRETQSDEFTADMAQ